MTDIATRVEEAIRARVNEIVDPDAIKALVDAELHRLTKPQSAQYGGRAGESILSRLVRQGVQNMLTDEIQKTLGREDTKQKIVEAVAATITGPEGAAIFRAIVAGLLEPVLSQIRGY